MKSGRKEHIFVTHKFNIHAGKNNLIFINFFIKTSVFSQCRKKTTNKYNERPYAHLFTEKITLV